MDFLASAADGKKTGDRTGVGFFIPLPKELAELFPSLGDEDKSGPHVTLLYVGTVEKKREALFLDTVRRVLSQVHRPVDAVLMGMDYFLHPDKNRRVAVLPVRFDYDMAALKWKLRDALIDAKFQVDDSFPLIYRPHVTLAYLDGLTARYQGDVPSGSWRFSGVEVWGLPRLHTLDFGVPLAARVASCFIESSSHKRSLALMQFLADVARQLGISKHVYVVGGAVRNFIINEPIKDIDVVVDSVSAGKDSAWFARELQKAIPVQTSFVTNNYGVVLMNIKEDWFLGGENMKGEDIEIANARKESYGEAVGKGYKPHMVEPATIEEDVTRREFTFNTLMWRLYDLADGPDKAEIVDLTGCGLRDLQEGMMRCPGSPDKTFTDDPSRMIRAIKFLIKYGFRIAPDVEASIRKNADKLKNIPPGHLSNMIITLFFEPGYGLKALKEMERLGLLNVVRQIAEKDKAFRESLANWADRSAKVEFLFDLMDLNMPTGRKLKFLSPPQLVRLREITSQMTQDEAAELIRVLEQPGKAVNMEHLISEFGLQGADIKKLTIIIRELILDDPVLASASAHLERKIRERMGKTATAGIHLLYHVTSWAGLQDILRTGKVESRAPFVSFSKKPLFHGDVRHADVALVLDADKLRDQVVEVHYDESWFYEHRDHGSYIAGEGWREQYIVPDECFEWDEEAEEEIENEDCIEEADYQAELDAFLAKDDEDEWISKNEGAPVQVGDALDGILVQAPSDLAKAEKILDAVGMTLPVRAGHIFKMASQYKTAVALTKQWLMGLRRGWLQIIKAPIQDYDGVMDKLTKLYNFAKVLKEDLKFLHRGTEYSSVLPQIEKKFEVLEKNLDQAFSSARGWKSFYDRDHPGMAWGEDRYEDGLKMLELYKKDFDEATSGVVKTKKGPSNPHGRSSRSSSLTEIFDGLLKVLYVAAKELAEHQQTVDSDSALAMVETVFRQFEIGRMKVLVIADHVKPDYIFESGPILSANTYVGRIIKTHALLRAKKLDKVWYGKLFVSGIEPKTLDASEKKVYQQAGYDIDKAAGFYSSGTDSIEMFSSPYDQVEDGILHELGHRYWFKFLDAEDRDRFSRWIEEGLAPVTPYGKTNPAEAFAEVFSHYCLNKDMSRDQLESFKTIVKRSSLVARVASRFIRAYYFNLGDVILYGKYKNKQGIVKSFGKDKRGNPTVIIEPYPKGRKQDKEFGLYKIWHADLTKRVAARWLRQAIININNATDGFEDEPMLRGVRGLESSLTAYERAIVQDMDISGEPIKFDGSDHILRGHRLDSLAVGELVGAGYLEWRDEWTITLSTMWEAKKKLYTAAKYQDKKTVKNKDGEDMVIYEYSDRQVANRNREKAERVEKLRGRLESLIKQVKKDLSSDDLETRMTALAIGLINDTYERVGNGDSAKDGHYGVTGWLVKHVKIGDGKATFKYVGKSGVDHEKETEDKDLVRVLKEAVEGKEKSDPVFEMDDFSITAETVNEYLKPFDITAKDIRGLHANREVQKALKSIRSKGGKLPEDKKEREKKLKDEFKEALEIAAEAVGHEPATLKNQYLVPGVEENFLKDGTVKDNLARQKMATKTHSEREDEEAEKLVKPLPKKNPPRHDLRDETVDTDKDEDLKGSRADEDEDLSLNFKKVATVDTVAFRWMMGRGGKRPKPRPKTPEPPKPPTPPEPPKTGPADAGKPSHKIGDIWETEGGWSVKLEEDTIRHAPTQEEAKAILDRFRKGEQPAEEEPGKEKAPAEDEEKTEPESPEDLGEDKALQRDADGNFTGVDAKSPEFKEVSKKHDKDLIELSLYLQEVMNGSNAEVPKKLTKTKAYQELSGQIPVSPKQRRMIEMLLTTKDKDGNLTPYAEILADWKKARQKVRKPEKKPKSEPPKKPEEPKAEPPKSEEPPKPEQPKSEEPPKPAEPPKPDEKKPAESPKPGEPPKPGEKKPGEPPKPAEPPDTRTKKQKMFDQAVQQFNAYLDSMKSTKEFKDKATHISKMPAAEQHKITLAFQDQLQRIRDELEGEGGGFEFDSDTLEGISDAVKSPFGGYASGPDEIGQSMALAMVGRQILANPTILDGRELSDAPMKDEEGYSRAVQSATHFSRLTPELRAEAMRQAAAELRKLPDGNKRVELERIVDGIHHASIVSGDFDEKKSKTFSLRPPPSAGYRQVVKVLAAQGNGKDHEFLKMSMSEGGLASDKGKELVRSALDNMDDETFVEACGGNSGPYGKALKVLDDDIGTKAHDFLRDHLTRIFTDGITSGNALAVQAALEGIRKSRKKKSPEGQPPSADTGPKPTGGPTPPQTPDSNLGSDSDLIPDLTEEPPKGGDSPDTKVKKIDKEVQKETGNIAAQFSECLKSAGKSTKKRNRCLKDHAKALKRSLDQKRKGMPKSKTSAEVNPSDISDIDEMDEKGLADACTNLARLEQARSYLQKVEAMFGELPVDEPLKVQVETALRLSDASELDKKYVRQADKLGKKAKSSQCSLYKRGCIVGGPESARWLRFGRTTDKEDTEMTKKMSKKGALSVTAALDRLAELFEADHATLGIEPRIAKDFAHRCDLLSDDIERRAGVSRRALTEYDPVKEQGFNPEGIGQEKSGPLEMVDSHEPWMNGEFSQQEKRELRYDQQSGKLGPKPVDGPRPPMAGKQGFEVAGRQAVVNRLGQAETALNTAAVRLASANQSKIAKAVSKLAQAMMDAQMGVLDGTMSAPKSQEVLEAAGHVIRNLASINPETLPKIAKMLDLALKVAKKSEEDEKEDKKDKKDDGGKENFFEKMEKAKADKKAKKSEDDEPEEDEEPKKAKKAGKKSEDEEEEEPKEAKAKKAKRAEDEEEEEEEEEPKEARKSKRAKKAEGDEDEEPEEESDEEPKEAKKANHGFNLYA